MNIISMEEESFFSLIETVIKRISLGNSLEQQWINESDAMRLLNIKSKTTLQKYRDRGWIRFSQPSKKVILYDRDSINQLLEKHAKNAF